MIKKFILLYLVLLCQNLFAINPDLQIVYVTKTTTLWTEPTETKQGVATVEAGLKLYLLNYQTGEKWAQVRTPKGRVGWIETSSTSLEGRRSKPVVKEGNYEESFEDNVDLWKYSFNKLWSFRLGGEYANQINLDQTHGFGARGMAEYFINNQWAIGAGIEWNIFRDVATENQIEVIRSAQRFLMGPHVRFQDAQFAIDLRSGFEILKTVFEANDLNTGSEIPLNGTTCDGANPNQSEGAFGLSISPAFRWAAGSKSAVEIYTSYAVGFHGGASLLCGESGVTPQQLSAGFTVQLF